MIAQSRLRAQGHPSQWAVEILCGFECTISTESAPSLRFLQGGDAADATLIRSAQAPLRMRWWYPPFAKCAKDGAPIWSALPGGSKAWANRPIATMGSSWAGSSTQAYVPVAREEHARRPEACICAQRQTSCSCPHRRPPLQKAQRWGILGCGCSGKAGPAPEVYYYRWKLWQQKAGPARPPVRPVDPQQGSLLLHWQTITPRGRLPPLGCNFMHIDRPPHRGHNRLTGSPLVLSLFGLYQYVVS
jgi:hypothetical protein